MSANEKQVAGNHYAGKVQHWDLAADRGYDYFQGQITKYVDRWKKKNGLVDLEKAQHFLEKYIELVREGAIHDAPKMSLGKYPDNYQEQLSEKMEKMRADAMQGYSDKLSRELVAPYPKSILHDSGDPQSHGYVNQDNTCCLNRKY